MKQVRTVVVAALVMAAPTVLGAACAAPVAEEKKLSAGAIEMWASNTFDTVDQTFAESYVNHQEPDVDGGTKTLDLKSWQELAGPFHQAFPDAKVEILLQLGEGDLVATRWRFTATQTGTYLGLAPTGKTISWTGAQIDRFEDGKISETWVNWDMYGMFRQLGLVNKQQGE